jgi:hypothetical protein
MTTIGQLSFGEVMKRAIVAGAAGGLAEIAWVSLYAAMTGGDAAVIARGVTTAVGLNAMLPTLAVGTGVVVHMVLAVLLGVPAVMLWQAMGKRLGLAGGYAAVMAALAGVWMINFFVLLPLISPPFITMLPYAVSLTSKLLFGLAAAETLRRFALAEVTPALARR